MLCVVSGWPVVIGPLFVRLCTVSLPRSSNSVNFEVDDVHRLYPLPVLLPSCDPWTMYFDRSHSKVDNFSIAQNQAAKLAKDHCAFDVSHKLKLWTMSLLPKLPARRDDLVSPEPAEITLSRLAAVSRQKPCTNDVSDVKLRLAAILGKPV